MVDLRPLLFLNALVVMLFFTAGFAQIKIADVSEPKAGTAIELAESVSPPSLPSNMPTSDTSLAAAVSNEQSDAGVQDSAIFADEPQFAEVHQASDMVFPEESALGSEQQTNEPVLVAALDPTLAPTPMTDATSTVQLPPEPLTGKLIIRSNVVGDKVRINGQDYGSTMLELELEPGEYMVEVTKPGYKGWTQGISVQAGSQSTLRARLEQLTTVEFRNGTWKYGIVTGEGTYLGKDGTRYEGGFLDRRFHGKGKLTLPDGTSYEGEWRDGKKEGFGNLVLPNGDQYLGHFRDDEFNGEGTLTKASGDIYSGNWLNGKLNGEGSLTTKQGLMYVGGFIENEFSGTGDITYPDGTHYQGGFAKSLFHGHGMLTYRDGKKYTGQFLEGQFHGKGELQNPNGSKISGTFKFGKPYGQATLTTPEGEVFTARSSEPGVCYRLKSYRATQCPPMEGW